jgi:hypothetical protein
LFDLWQNKFVVRHRLEDAAGDVLADGSDGVPDHFLEVLYHLGPVLVKEFIGLLACNKVLKRVSSGPEEYR